MNLFIDTNVFLTFYHFTQDDLEELQKLSVSIEGSKIILYTTEQVKFEFLKNREARINDSLKKIKNQSLPNQFPQICKDYEEEYKEMWKNIKKYEEQRSEMLIKLQEDIEKKTLKLHRGAGLN